MRRELPLSELLPYQIDKTFNKVTGEIDRKFAWDSIFYDLKDQGRLKPILKTILIEDYD